jgi:signal transduction histidine kinase
MPALLLERGLVAAVEDMADRSPIRTVLDIDEDGYRGDGTRLPQPVEGTAYAVIAEALTNAVKHASASTITIAVHRDRDRLCIRVDDDGVGGAGAGVGRTGRRSPVGGAGLRGMTDRVSALDGTLTIDSPPGAGTRVFVELPCAS